MALTVRLGRGSAVLRSFHLGLDLGQRQDHSAIVVLEQRIELTGKVDAGTYEHKCVRKPVIRMAEQVPLHQSYFRIVEAVHRLTSAPELKDSDGVTTSFDATGVGNGVADIFRTKPPYGRMYPVVFTAGDTAHYKDGLYYEPKNQLMVGLLRAFEMEGLCVAAEVDGWELLERELLSMRRLPGNRLNVGAGLRWVSDGKHDDLVMALALALHGMRMNLLPVQGDRVRRRIQHGKL